MNSDGNLTFGEGDVATDRPLPRPRALRRARAWRPSSRTSTPRPAGGIFVNAAPDAFTVTWCAVPDFDATGKVTAQASLLPGGAVEIRIDAATTLEGRGGGPLSGGDRGLRRGRPLRRERRPRPAGSGAVGERFAAEASLDLVSASRRFYAEFADNYDQLLFWSDTRVVESGTFAFETTIQNAITGIGQEVVSFAAAYGSGGRLSSLVVMDDLGKYPADPVQRANGENSTLALVAHETGHRWGATLQFRDASEGVASDAWLGRQRAHWSFYCDSDASVLEGNEIEDQGGGSFRTAATVSRYGPFDLYAMGLLGRVRGAARLLRGEPLGREPGPGVGAPDGGQPSPARGARSRSATSSRRWARATRPPRAPRARTGRRGSTSWAAGAPPTPPRSRSSRRSAGPSRASSRTRPAAA